MYLYDCSNRLCDMTTQRSNSLWLTVTLLCWMTITKDIKKNLYECRMKWFSSLHLQIYLSSLLFFSRAVFQKANDILLCFQYIKKFCREDFFFLLMNVATAVEAVKTHFGLSFFSFFLCGICEGKIYSDFWTDL